MYFIFSKFVGFLLQPLSWILLLLIIALMTRRPRRRKRALVLGVVIILVFSNKFLFTTVLKQWEIETPTMDQVQQNYDIGILLGGYSAPEIRPNQDRHNFNSRANRFTNALELYFKGKIDKILLTGGTHNMPAGFPNEAQSIGKYLETLGVAPEDIIVEAESRNTRENALYTAEIIRKQYPDASCLLITSAWHMKRAKACFDRVYLKTTPFSVDFMSEIPRPGLGFYLSPAPDVFENWEYLLKEWVGFLVYRTAGYI